MKLQNNTVLITGGTTGIGLGMAEKYLEAGSTVIICARSIEALDEAKQKHPAVHIYQCDVSDKLQREELYDWTISNFPDLNILVNNAGIQRQNSFVNGADIASFEEEINTNFTAPVHFSALFIPHLKTQEDSAIINISSGLGYVPIARMPVYGATKAAIHSFTWSLRRQLRDTAIKVFEIIPPIVDTNLDHGTRPASFRGITVGQFIKEAIENILNDTFEAPVGDSKNFFNATKEERQIAFNRMNG